MKALPWAALLGSLVAVDAVVIIGVGLPRSGVGSMKGALEILGYGPTYEQSDALRDDHLAIWAQDEPDWDVLFQNFSSTVGSPSAFWLPELLAHFPDAKVILTLRDTKTWRDSLRGSICRTDFPVSTFDRFVRWFRGTPYFGFFFPMEAKRRRLQEITAARLLAIPQMRAAAPEGFKTVCESDSGADELFKAWTEWVMGFLPPQEHANRLLLFFTGSHSWPALAYFLKVDAIMKYSIPFPFINTSIEYFFYILRQRTEVASITVLPVLLLALLRWVLTPRKPRKKKKRKAKQS